MNRCDELTKLIKADGAGLLGKLGVLVFFVGGWDCA